MEILLETKLCNAVRLNKVDEVKNLILNKKCNVPSFLIEELFNNETNAEIIDLVCEGKLYCDLLVKKFSDYMKYRNIIKINEDTLYEQEIDDKTKYIIYSMIMKASSAAILLEDIPEKYHTLLECLDICLSSALYNAEVTLAHKIKDAIESKYGSVRVCKKTKEDFGRNLRWLSENVQKAEKGRPVGVRSGPESGKWPSLNPEDYVKSYHLMWDIDNLTNKLY